MENLGKITRGNFYIQPKQQKENVASDKNSTPAKDSNTNSNKSKELLLGSLSAVGVIGLSIVAITQRSKIQKLLQELNKAANKPVNNSVQAEETLIPYCIKPLKDTELYKSFGEETVGIFNFLENSNTTPQSVKEFLFGLTSDKKASSQFIEEILQNPRESAKHLKLLKDKIGGWKNLSEWLQAPKGYQEAYKNYIQEKAPTLNVEELIKISPNWHLYFLNNKTGNNLTFGKLPKEFQNIKNYSHFVNWLASMRGEFKVGEKVVKEYGGNYMEIESLKEGLSGKYPLKIQFLDIENGTQKGKPYILKIQESYGSDHNAFAKESIAYRSDSVFLNAQLDHYLNLHDCKNTVKFHYFDYNSNSGLYDFVEGQNTVNTENILEGNKLVEDMNRLGIQYNDVCITNIIKCEDGYKVIDIGDSTFIDPLRPGVKGLQFEVPNWCGNSIPNFAMALKL